MESLRCARVIGRQLQQRITETVGGIATRIMQKILEIFMTNINKILALFLQLILAQTTYAIGSAIVFDRAELIAFDDNSVVKGYYNAQGEKRSCTFLFVQKGGQVEAQAEPPYSEAKVLTFVPGEKNFTYSSRDKFFDIPGELFRRDETWLIRTDEGQAGCENALGSFTSFPKNKVGGEIFTVENKIPAVGIRLIARKTNLHALQGGKFLARKAYLTKWDDVIVIRTRDQFSYVRFANTRVDTPNLGRVTTGWVRSADLVNPFPSTNEP
nr:hypothetical protein [Paraburkholderia caribensis]